MPVYTDSNPHIPFFKTINEFLEAINSAFRTQNPLLLCLRLEETFPQTVDVMPPFRKDFFFISMITDIGSTEIWYDDDSLEKEIEAFIVFQSPSHIYSWRRDKTVKGYLIYFKKECFDFFRPELEQEFPFFNPVQTNFYKLTRTQYNAFMPWFEEVFDAYQEFGAQGNLPIPALKLLSLMYQMKQFTNLVNQLASRSTSAEQLIFQKYLQLISNAYLVTRTIEAYAELLHITPHYLSQSIKAVTGKNALYYINERILKEAKILIRFTPNDIAEIAYQLNFSDPANFGKFFKKHTGQTPLEYRKAFLQK